MSGMLSSLMILLLATVYDSMAQAKIAARAEVKDWFALGSGCRGKENGPGDVKMSVSSDPTQPNSLKIRFAMGSYQLSGDKPVRQEHPNFARECALRFSIQPPPFSRVKNVELNTKFLLQKDKGASAEVHSRLMTPQGTLKDWQHVVSSEKEVREERVDLHLSPDENGKRILKDVSCGDPKIFGADFTFENKRSSFKEKVDMKHDSPNQVEFVVDFERCGQ